MIRQRLEMSLVDLKKEVSSYGITNIPKSREGCLDVLLTHLERNGPLEEAQATFVQEARGEPDLPGSATTGTLPKDNSAKNFTNGKEKDASTEYLPQLCTLLVHQISKQSEQMNQLQQMFAAMMDTSVKGRQHAQSEDQQEVRHSEEFFSVPPSQAVKFLATQIPQFSGLDEDDVNIWLEKIESIAALHRLSTSVMLSAAANKPAMHDAGIISAQRKQPGLGYLLKKQ